MNKFLLTFSALALLAVTADAAPRGGGRGFYGGGGRGFYGDGGRGFYGPGYGYGYNPGIRVAPGVRIGGGYYGPGYGYGGYNSFYGPRNGYGRTGVWFGTGLYGSIPLTARGGYGNGTYVVPTTTIDGVETIPQSNSLASPVDGSAGDEWGLKVTQVMDGGAAKKADLRNGDIILGVGQTRTQTLGDLQQALAAANGKVDVVFINAENKKIEKIPVTPANGKIGVTVEPVDLP